MSGRFGDGGILVKRRDGISIGKSTSTRGGIIKGESTVGVLNTGDETVKEF